ncbi:MAG: tRNA pseudouridine(55) synthase TruB [Planctomycetes bacterium]|nr:tRNA pseudouridine(55) synthase TruB [Planctomycetota bacterium]
MGSDGILVIDKPNGVTSRDVVNRAQRWFPRKTPIGHAGTLDPLATGVLVLCMGSATRLIEYVQRMPKTYRAGVVLGATSDTDDADGMITPTPDAAIPTRERIDHVLAGFIGDIEQVPPAFSAAKVAGRRAYDLARKGKDVELQPRTVAIHRIDVVRYSYPELEMVVQCGKGTYIRSIARDLGRSLGCGGYIATLRRLAIGWFTEAEACAMNMDAETARERLLPAWRAVQDRMPGQVSDDEARQLLEGRRIAPAHAAWTGSGLFAVIDRAGRTVAIVEVVDGLLRPVKVLIGGG